MDFFEVFERFFHENKNSQFIDVLYFFVINNNGCIETCVACHFQNTLTLKDIIPGT